MELLKELLEVRETQAKRMLAESVTEYLATIIGHLKSKEYHDLFNTDTPLVKIDQLASVISGLKILSDHEVRSTLTVDDVKINPNSSMQMFNLLNSIPKTGKGVPKLTLDVFKALSEVSPKHYSEEKVRLKALKSKDESQRLKAIAELEKLAEKVGKMFNKVRSIAHGTEDE